jgi:hypothetical protein
MVAESIIELEIWIKSQFANNARALV